MQIELRIAELGLSLPIPATPLANYVPFKIINLSSAMSMADAFEKRLMANGLLYVSGMTPLQDGVPFATGKLGAEVTLEQGIECSQICTLNALSWASVALEGDLDRIIEVVQVRGFIACTADFFELPKVLNGASDLLVDIFGDDGRHVRAVVGCNALPLNVPVEIEYVFALR